MAKVADGIRYAEKVVAGEIIACDLVKLACQRFLDDLKTVRSAVSSLVSLALNIFLIFINSFPT